MSKALAFEEILSDPRHIRSDLRLLERAVLARWEIPHSAKRRIVERLREIVDDIKRRTSETSIERRVMLRAQRVHLAMARVNREDVASAIGSLLGLDQASSRGEPGPVSPGA
jgi:hypothetical protein